MARFMMDEIGNMPLAPEEVSQEAVQAMELFMARNPPGNALVIRSNAAREAYGYEVSPEAQEAREDVARMQRLFAGATAGTPTSFKDRLYGYANRGPGNVEDRSDQPPYEPPSMLDLPFKRGQAARDREERKQKERELLEELKDSQLARDIGLPDVGLPPSRWPRSAVP